MDSIFILGGSRLQVPAIIKAKEKGLFVYVLDYDSSAVGIKYADKFLEISTIDIDAVYEAALRYQPKYIITSTSDMPVRTVSWVCEKLGKKTDITYENALCATDKSMMRARMRECKVPIPQFYASHSISEFEEIITKMPDRFIVKPADSSSSRGVVLIDKRENNNYSEIYEYSLNYSRSGVVLIEEYMDGPEVSVEAFSIEGEPHIVTITDKLVTEIPYFVEVGHTEPSRLPLDIQEKIKEVAYEAIKAIGMKNGPTHTEIKITTEGPKLVEIGPRLGGDFITSRLVPLSTGVDMINCSFSSLLGENIECEPKYTKGAAIRFLQGKTGMLKAISGVEEARNMPGIQEVEIYCKVGDYVNELKSSNDRLGHIIAVGTNAEDASDNAEEALRNIKILIE